MELPPASPSRRVDTICRSSSIARMTQEIAALESPLLLSADQEVATSEHIAIRLEILAGRFAPADRQLSSLHGYPQKEWSNLPLFRMIDAILRRLEKTSE